MPFKALEGSNMHMPQDVRERWEMRLCPDGIMAQQTLYSIISLAQLCQGWNLHSGHGRCNWDIGSLIGHRDTNPDWGSYVLLYIQFTFEIWEHRSADKIQAIRLGSDGERAERSKYFTIILKIFYKKLWSLGAAWKSEIWDYCSQASNEKGFVGRGWNVKWYVRSEAANWWHP